MEKRKRNNRLYIRVNDDEKKMIEDKMNALGVNNFMAYARKMLIDGAVVKYENRTDDNVVIELKRIGNNINQIARVLNSSKEVKDDTISSIRNYQKQIWQLLK